ncbi:hypothetical protein [Thiofilum flexile]|uniref:hypothetical protein n=1 Tax=Thiofilum flexile TaxID=125627 RepID=UPI00036E73BD|nr:hypothetical protein [Thiofilum flexile]
MRIKTVALAQVMQWYQFGYELWYRYKWQWLLVSLVCSLMLLGVAVIPGVNWLMYVVLPLVIAALLYMARRAVQGYEPGLEQFAFILGLTEQRTQLLWIGLGLAVLMLLVSFSGRILQPPAVLNYTLAELAQAQRGMEVGHSFFTTLLNSLIQIAAVCFAAIALLFAPALALFRKVPAWLAVKSSLRAFWLNKGALLFFLFIQTMLTLLALLPFGLGLLVLLPITVLALYRAYTEIFISTKPNP